MAENVTIGSSENNLFLGEDKVLRLHVKNSAGVPVDIAGWAVLFNVRESDKASIDVLVKSAAVQGTYDADPDDNTQRAVVTLTDTETAALSAKLYRYSFKRTDDGSETILAFGPFVPQRATQI